MTNLFIQKSDSHFSGKRIVEVCMWRKLRDALFNRENFLALMLAFILIALVIFASDTSATWIYQGF